MCPVWTKEVWPAPHHCTVQARARRRAGRVTGGKRKLCARNFFLCVARSCPSFVLSVVLLSSLPLALAGCAVRPVRSRQRRVRGGAAAGALFLHCAISSRISRVQEIGKVQTHSKEPGS